MILIVSRHYPLLFQPFGEVLLHFTNEFMLSEQYELLSLLLPFLGDTPFLSCYARLLFLSGVSLISSCVPFFSISRLLVFPP